MPEPQSTIDLPAGGDAIRPAAEAEAARRAALCDTERVDAISYDWAHVGFGIILAGGAYPFIAAAIGMVLGSTYLAYQVSIGAAGGDLIETIVEPLLIVGVGSLAAALVGIAWSGLVTALTLPVIYAVTWTLKLQASIVSIGAFSGALVGFICVLPLTLSLPRLTFQWVYWDLAIPILFGPALATIVGQVGGAWGGSNSREIGTSLDWKKRLTAAGGWQSKDDASGDSGDGQPPFAAPPRIQFSIRHLLWIAVWLSLLLTLIRLSGIPYEFMLPLLVGWLLYQAATMWVGRRLIARVERWRAARRLARST